MLEQTKRIEALDIAKGIGIILVIIGHMVSSYPFMWIYSFHMPLFFIISGICFKEEKYPSFLQFIKKRIQTIAIPAVALYFIILTLQTIVGVSGLNLQEQWEGVHPGSLWFLVTLFLIELLYFPLCRIPIRWRIPLLLASACLGVFFSRNQITFFFDLTNVFFCTALYGFGNLISRFLPFILKSIKRQKKVIVVFLSICMLSIPVLLIVLYGESFNLSFNRIPKHTILFTFTAITSTVSVIILSTILPFKKILTYLGQNTLVLLAFHGIPIDAACLYISPYISNHIAFKLIQLITTFFFSCAFIPIFNNYLPWCIGKRKQNS